MPLLPVSSTKPSLLLQPTWLPLCLDFSQPAVIMFSRGCTGKVPLVLGDYTLPKSMGIAWALIWALCEIPVFIVRQFGVGSFLPLIEILV